MSSINDINARIRRAAGYLPPEPEPNPEPLGPPRASRAQGAHEHDRSEPEPLSFNDFIRDACGCFRWIGRPRP